jgi:long-chain fatty acid transport protein
VAGVCALLFGAGSAAGSPLDIFGFGGKSPALGGTGVATATEFDAVFLNPAGLADTPKKRLTIGGMSGSFALALDGVDTGTDAPTGVTFGGALPIPLGGALKDRIGLGLGFHIPTTAINRASHPVPGVPVFELLHTRTQVIALQLALGVEINDKWRVGAGVITLAELDGGIHVDTDAAGRFTTQSEQRLITRFAPVVGTRYLHSDTLQLGATFRGTSRADYNILVTNDLADSLPLTIPTLRIAGAAQYTPLTVAMEGAWRAKPSVQLALQLAYQRWSAYPLPTINPVEGTAPQDEPGFHDIVVPRFGAQWSTASGSTHLDVRGGYAFIMSPAPEMDGRQSMLDNHRHIFTTGLGVSWPTSSVPLYLDVWFQTHLLAPRNHTKDLTVYEPGEVAPYFTIEATGQIYAGGLTVGVDL